MSSSEYAVIDAARLAPAPDWREIVESDHFVQFYEHDSFLLDSVSGFIAGGFAAHTAGLVVATAAHREALEQRWIAEGVDVAAAKARGQYIALDAAETLAKFVRDGVPQERLFRETLGGLVNEIKGRYPRLRVFGEMVALLWQDGNHSAAARLEELWNELNRAHAFSLFCAYPLKVLGGKSHGKPFLHICNAHTRVIPAESYAGLTDPDERLRAISELQQKASSLDDAITEREAAERSLLRQEKELSDFVENALEGLHRADPDGTILWANKAEFNLLGYAPEEYIGRPTGEFHVERDVADDIRRRLLNGETLHDYPAKLRCKDGSVRHVLIHANALFENGKIVYTRRFTRDITDRKRLEEELQQRIEQLAEVDRRKDEFLAMLGHELRNPLSPIVSALQLMHVTTEPEKIVRARDIIERQVGRVTRLVDELLDVSRITRSKITLRREMVRLTELVENALEPVRPLIHERGHRLTLELPSQPVWLFADPARLEQVLTNLLQNAAKYTELGGIIRLSAYSLGGWLVVSVRDNGVGLSPELREHMFDMFVQGQDARTQARGGLGIGLTLARTLLELHGGSIEARSDGPGFGSEFLMRLPLPNAAAVPVHAAAAPARPRPAPVARRFLVVDDNIDAADALAELLQAMGHSVRVSYSGRAALDSIARFRPEVVLLDIAMPEMDGYEVARRLRHELGTGSPVLVAVTGFDQECDYVRSKAAGFDHHVVKPLDVHKLETLLPARAAKK